MMASKSRMYDDDTELSAIRFSDDPREQKHLQCQVRHFDPASKLSQHEEMHVALENTG